MPQSFIAYLIKHIVGVLSRYVCAVPGILAIYFPCLRLFPRPFSPLVPERILPVRPALPPFSSKSAGKELRKGRPGKVHFIKMYRKVVFYCITTVPHFSIFSQGFHPPPSFCRIFDFKSLPSPWICSCGLVPCRHADNTRAACPPSPFGGEAGVIRRKIRPPPHRRRGAVSLFRRNIHFDSRERGSQALCKFCGRPQISPGPGVPFCISSSVSKPTPG